MFKRIINAFSKKKVIFETCASLIYGGISKYSIKKKDKFGSQKSSDDSFIKTFSGDYAKQIMLDGNALWNIDNDIVNRSMPHVNDDEILPSDARYRPDKALLIRNNLPVVNNAKITLENLQRREEKMRTYVKKKHRL